MLNNNVAIWLVVKKHW